MNGVPVSLVPEKSRKPWFWRAVIGLLVLGGCGGEAPTPTAPAPSTIEADDAPEFPHLAQVELTAPVELAAVAPFGLMRITVAQSSPEAGILFRHARVAGAPDLLLTLRNASRAPVPGKAGNPPGQDRPDQGGVSASPGRIVAVLPSRGLVAEATTRSRLAAYRITVPAGERIELRLSWLSTGEAAGQWAPARGRRAVNGALAGATGAALHAAMRFDHAFTDATQESGATVLRFTPPGGVLQLRFALSTTDLAGARGNLADGENLGFDGVLRSTRAAWDALLGRFTVRASGEVRRRVATDWYRVLAHYGDLADRDGRFRGPDGSLRRVGEGKAYLGNLDLERNQWAVLPLLDLLAPERLQGFPETLLLHQRATGVFPRRTAWGWPTEEALPATNPDAAAPAILAGFASRGKSTLDAGRMLPPVIKATRGPRSPAGYIPFDAGPPPSVSRTLAASRGDQAVAVIAAAAGDRETAGAFAARAVFYRLLYDAETGAFRGRSRAGDWRKPFPPGPAGSPAADDYADGRWAEALWTPALFDIDGLLELLGGQAVLGEHLDAAFAAGPDPGGLDATRPTMQHTPWLYGFTNRPERTRAVLDALAPSRDGVTADAAAWRLFTVLGLYPVLPAEGEYLVAPPAVEQASLLVKQGLLQLNAPGSGPGSWNGGILVDGQPVPGRLMSHQRLVRGGSLSFESQRESGAD